MNPQIDVDANTGTASELGVRAMPTFFFFRDSNKLGEVVGANPSAVLDAIKKFI